MASQANIGRPASNIYTVLAIAAFICLVGAVTVTWQKNVEITKEYQDPNAQFKNPFHLIEK